jgi:AraC-like DNA-binding protein
MAAPAKELAVVATRSGRLTVGAIGSGRVSDATITSFVAHTVIRAAEKAGVNPAPLYQLTGLSPGVVPAGDAHLDIERYYQLWERVATELDNPAVSLLAVAESRLEDNELFGFLAISCESLGEAFARTARYRVLYNRGARWELQQEREATRVIWYPWPGDRKRVGVRAAIEFAVLDMCASARQLSRTNVGPLEVRFAHGKAPYAAALQRFFGVAPVFDATLDELVFPPDILATPIASFNSRLRDYFEEQCRQLSTQFAADAPVAVRVRKELMAAMDGGDSSMDAVAARLGMSGRSLHRRLAEEGTRYNDMLDEIRQEFAKRYLARGTVSASEVAYLVGFQSPTAFFRAFKRWTGQTPAAYRP